MSLRSILLLIFVFGAATSPFATTAQSTLGDAELSRSALEEKNKALARQFYEQVWFSPNSSAVDELVAPNYVVHDVGDRKGVTEPASEQKEIADFFWKNGTMTGSIDYQIADGDLVATRWQWQFHPEPWYMKAFNNLAQQLGGRESIPIINVFRFKDGKIVEVWNHRHDVDTGITSTEYFLKGLLLGLIPAVLLAIMSFWSWRKRRRFVRLAV